MRKFLVLAVLLGILAFCNIAERPSERSAEPPPEPPMQYPGPWRDSGEGVIPITRTLILNNVRVCGEMWWRARYDSSGEYLVYCHGFRGSETTRQWTAWLVWPRMEKVSALKRLYPGIPLPR
jgi:hypothetical protein